MNLSIVILLSLSRINLLIMISVFCMKLPSLTRIIILNLALSDLLFTVGPLFWVYDHIWGSTLGETVCKVYSFYSSVGFYSSMVFLVLMSVERYMAVVHPQSDWKKEFCVRDGLVFAWVMSILVALPVMVNINAQSYSGGCRYSKTIPYVITMYKELLLFVSAFLVMGFCYIRILPTVKFPGNHSNITTGLAFVLVTTFFICWAPYNTLNLLYILDYHQIWIYTNEKHLINGTYICFILAFTRCCLNPVIYGLFGLESGKREEKRAASETAPVGTEHEGSSHEYCDLSVNKSPRTSKPDDRSLSSKRSCKFLAKKKRFWCI
ncbi:chemokine XC receptor 1 [Silurus meridionalis]|nr:chemokine XC receptor 1 [Silurus meridionalis]